MKLFEPLVVRGMTLKNRIVMPPMLVGVGYRGQRARAYYGERAKGGVAAITVAGTSVDLFVSDDAWGRPGGVASFAEGAHLLAETVHQAGARIGVQLWYGNRFPAGMGETDRRGVPVAPSPKGEMCALTITEIEEIISRFARAAAKVKEIGFDYAEVHGAHGYLVCQFFSLADNKRTDRYGGDLAGRMRFGTEIVSAVRRAVGQDFPLYYRLGAWEDRPEGIAIEDGVKFAIDLEKAGVDVLDISVGAVTERGLSAFNVTPIEGGLVPYAAAVKKMVGIPVIAVGRIKTPAFAESVLVERKADLIAIGRQLIADPYWPQKVAEGKEDEIVPCLNCNVCADTGFLQASGLRCSVNASVTREPEFYIKPVKKPKKVFVIGGGPAGMEAAGVAAQRGHEVTLYEKKDRLGSQLLTASIAPTKEEIAKLNKYLSHQLEKTGVKVRLGTEATAQMVEKVKPDAVVIATGASPIVPKDLPGVEGENTITAQDALTEIKRVGKRVIIVGGGMVGCETAEFLAEKGRKVTILEMLEEIGNDIGVSNKEAVRYRLNRSGVETFTRTRAQEITKKGVRAIRHNSTQFFEADTVVLAVGFSPNSELTNKLEGKIASLYSIGDCVKPQKIVDAIGDGARVGREI